jgi:serine phosphatase RsbU (regulator of sigma subunit)
LSKPIQISSKGIALGIMQNMYFEEKELALRPGDILVTLSSMEIKKNEQSVIEFSEGQPQFDDLTLLSVKVL